MMKKFPLWPGVLIYWLSLVGLAVFSFTQTDANLTWIINSDWFRNFQQAAWIWGADRERLQFVFKVLVVLSFVGFILVVRALKSWPRLALWQNRDWLKATGLILIIASPLFFAYNALSHDVFNYMFNAKMVWYYRANPHQQVALDFPQDDWLRFMHNTHTPAPYAYGWTIFSAPFGWLGAGKFLPTWLVFRLLSVVSLFLTGAAILLYANRSQIEITASRLALFMLNPLILIEIIMNMHNDLWMMAPAIWAFVWLSQSLGPSSKHLIGWLLVFLAGSIKYATLILLPLYSLVTILSLGLGKFSRRFADLSASAVMKILPIWAVILLFLLLLLPRSQQFHPWYLSWLLVWLPLLSAISWRWLEKLTSYLSCLLVIFSLTSLFRYLPWLALGGFAEDTLYKQQQITWLALPISLLVFLFVEMFRNKKSKLKVLS